jgi:predicted Zn-dependent protease
VTTRLEALLGCGFEVEYLSNPSLATGRADRGHAFVISGLIDFVQGDDELAVVIAHELGHRVLGDRSNGVFAEHEVAADRIGLFLAARAGYDVAVAPALWERLAIEKPWMIAFEPESNIEEEPAHARIGTRLPAMRRVVAEIREKQTRGDELMP